MLNSTLVGLMFLALAATSFAGQQSAVIETPVCLATVSVGEVPVSASGGTVEVRVQLKPAGCEPALGSSGGWLMLAAGQQKPGEYRFSIAPNETHDARLGVLAIGDQKVLVRQAAVSGHRFAASPGHVSLSVTSDKPPAPRFVTIYSDDKSLSYQLTAGQPWLSSSPVKSSPGSHRFQIAIEPAKLRPGRNEGYFTVTTVGQVSPPLTIPVVVEVPRAR